MDSCMIDVAGPWRRYQRESLRDWIILGTIRCDSVHATAALARSAMGVYARFNAGAFHSFDQRAVLAALDRAVRAGGVYHA